jgi:hypothetical protein
MMEVWWLFSQARIYQCLYNTQRNLIENIMEQSFLNWIFTAFGAAIGWVLKVIWDAISDLKQDMKALNKEVNEDFVRKEDYRVDIAEMKQMLNRIFDKLDNKVDK